LFLFAHGARQQLIPQRWLNAKMQLPSDRFLDNLS
jgi:hypothetical protein